MPPKGFKYDKDSKEVREALANHTDLPDGTFLDFYGSQPVDVVTGEVVDIDPEKVAAEAIKEHVAPVQKKQ